MAHIDHPIQKVVLETLRLSRTLQVAADKVYPDTSYTMRTMLTHIYRYGPKTISALAHHDNVSRQHMERLVTDAGERGWVSLIDNPARKRSHLVCLTKGGEAFATQVIDEVSIALEVLSEDLDHGRPILRRSAAVLRDLRMALDLEFWEIAIDGRRKQHAEDALTR
jgi:DNA-binding MarR family transcriptional regulator